MSRREGSRVITYEKCPRVGHNRNVPWLYFTLPLKNRAFAFAESLFSRDDSKLEGCCDAVLGKGARGTRQPTFPPPALSKPPSFPGPPTTRRDIGSHLLRLPHPP